MIKKPNYEELEQRLRELEKEAIGLKQSERLLRERERKLEELITERKQAEETLRESEERYRSLIYRIQAAVVVHDFDTQIIASNFKAQELLGLTEDQMMGKPANDPSWKFLHADGERMSPEEYPVNQVLVTQQPVRDLISGVYRPDQADPAWVLVNADPVLDDKEEIQQVIVTFVDITNRKLMEERIEQINHLKEKLLGTGNLNEKLRIITDGIVKIFEADFTRIWITKPGDLCDSGCMHAEVTEGSHICHYRDRCLHLIASSGRYTHIDGDHRRVPFGCYKIGRVAGGDDIKFFTNDVTNDPRIHDNDWAKELGLVSFAGYRLLAADGKAIGVLALFSKKTISSEEDAQLEGLANTTAQVIQTAKAEEALQESEEKFREFVEGTDDLITRVDSEGQLIYVNHVAEEIFGISMNQCVGMSAFDFIHPDDRERTTTEFNGWIRNRLRSVTFENRQVNKITGEVYHMFWTINLYYDEKGGLTFINGIARDLTKYKKLEKELLKAIKLESVGVLAGGMAHDFNNLLSIIMGNISLIKDDVKPEYGVTEFLNEAEKASLRAQELTKQLITFSKGGAPVKKTGSIGDLIKESTNFFISGSNVETEFYLSSDLYTVEFDQGQMKHAVKNIIDNAVESMPDGGSIIVKAVNLNISSEATEKKLPLSEGKYVKISIQDHGVGIPAEHLPKIFDPYFSTKERGIEKGMGLGLATTYSIINRHDGHITVESEVGVGTTFTIYFPAAVEEIVGIEPVKMVEPEKPVVRTGRILVMDDEEMIRRLSEQVLSRLGYEPETAKDGAEAIELYRKAMETGEPFDAVILDLTIKGGMGGKDAVKALLELDPQVKAIVSSGYSNDPVMTNFRAYGFIGALPKPYLTKDLSDMLN